MSCTRPPEVRWNNGRKRSIAPTPSCAKQGGEHRHLPRALLHRGPPLWNRSVQTRQARRLANLMSRLQLRMRQPRRLRLEPAPPKPESLGAAVQRIGDQEEIREVQREMAREKEYKEEEVRARQRKDAANRERAARESQLREEAHSAEVQRVLRPFLARRNLQPRLAGSSLQLYKTFEEQPMSLGALDSVGALHESAQGLSMLARIGSHRGLGSPRWDYPSSPRTWSPETEKKLKEAQDLLRRLGPTMVSEGLLSP